MEIKVKRLSQEVPMPTFAKHADAGFDLYTRESISLAPGERIAVPSGLALEIPEGYVGLVWDKSGIGIKGGIKTLGGVVDAGYRGEIMVGVINLSKEKYVFEKGHKVAQMLIQKIEQPTFRETDMLSESERGVNGFGSTGK